MICFCWWNRVKRWVWFCPPMWFYVNYTWHKDLPWEHIYWLRNRARKAEDEYWKARETK